VIRGELDDALVIQRHALAILAREDAPPASELDEVMDPTAPRGTDDRIGPPGDQDAGQLAPRLGLAGLANTPRHDLCAHRRHQLLSAFDNVELLGDEQDVRVDILERSGLGHDIGQLRNLEPRDDLLVPRHGKRREHEVRLERCHLVGVDTEVPPHSRQARNELRREIRVLIAADDPIAAAERRDDLRVRASQRDDALRSHHMLRRYWPPTS
jgi:hypothetical protein